ncbi:MAG: hypothetical protein ACFFDT_22700 [Candidatus Hodarchaeota archaeon]
MILKIKSLIKNFINYKKMDNGNSNCESNLALNNRPSLSGIATHYKEPVREWEHCRWGDNIYTDKREFPFYRWCSFGFEFYAGDEIWSKSTCGGCIYSHIVTDVIDPFNSKRGGCDSSFSPNDMRRTTTKCRGLALMHESIPTNDSKGRKIVEEYRNQKNVFYAFDYNALAVNKKEPECGYVLREGKKIKEFKSYIKLKVGMEIHTLAILDDFRHIYKYKINSIEKENGCWFCDTTAIGWVNEIMPATTHALASFDKPKISKDVDFCKKNRFSIREALEYVLERDSSAEFENDDFSNKANVRELKELHKRLIRSGRRDIFTDFVEFDGYHLVWKGDGGRFKQDIYILWNARN